MGKRNLRKGMRKGPHIALGEGNEGYGRQITKCGGGGGGGEGKSTAPVRMCCAKARGSF